MPNTNFEQLYHEQVIQRLDRMASVQAEHTRVDAAQHQELFAAIDQLRKDVSELQTKTRIASSILGFIAGAIPAAINHWLKS